MLRGRRKMWMLIFRSDNSNASNSTHQVFLSVLLLAIVLPQCIYSTPMRAAWESSTRAARQPEPCAHKSIAELIRTSPVILKALGARIFSQDDDLSWNGGGGVGQSRQSAVLQNGKSATQTAVNAEGNGDSATASAHAEVASILITLTPETIYKGASLLKMTPGNGGGNAAGGGVSAGASRREGGANLSGTLNGGGSSSSSSTSSSSSSNSAAESAYQYEGQLNATLEPLDCFDTNMLNILPTELIAFGKLQPVKQPQEEQMQPQNGVLEEQDMMLAQIENLNGQAKDVLHISINGLHRWTPQFENYIWKHLGWDDWSDFTLCSVTCGKGVQQRFRRCLLDNPMVNINMNMNLNGINDVGDDDVQEQDDEVDDADADADTDEHEYNAADNEVSRLKINANEQQMKATANNNEPTVTMSGSQAQSGQHSKTLTLIKEQKDTMPLHKLAQTTPMYVQSTKTYVADSHQRQTNNSQNQNQNQSQNQSWSQSDAWPLKQTGDSNEHQSVAFVKHDSADGYVMNHRHDNLTEVKNHPATVKSKKPATQHKKRKSAKTLFCEGYNIEQRNCNTFECSEEISDLLKFYKKLPTPDETIVTSSSLSLSSVNNLSSISSTENEYNLPEISSTLPTTMGNLQPSSTPANMGYIHSWHNSLNFTLMITLRVKNDTRNTATIFSIRNATHNLYLEESKDGLRLYLERDNTTEMIPVKFNLFDYRWHQVAISIQNGDFISIYVDCSWTNSFVVSKRLYSLPLDADVEIGRGFNGELQQLLVLPGHQERQQCSKRRTSINEVKRYIIDTFIDDYAN